MRLAPGVPCACPSGSDQRVNATASKTQHRNFQRCLATVHMVSARARVVASLEPARSCQRGSWIGGAGSVNAGACTSLPDATNKVTPTNRFLVPMLASRPASSPSHVFLGVGSESTARRPGSASPYFREVAWLRVASSEMDPAHQVGHCRGLDRHLLLRGFGTISGHRVGERVIGAGHHEREQAR